MATTAIDSLRGILNGFRDLNSKGIYPMNATETDLLRQILLEVESLSLGSASDPSQIVSSTLPTTRVNPSTGLPSGGDPLQIGDRWYNPSKQQEGFWNGTLWLSTKQIVFTRYRLVSNSSNLAFPTTVDLDGQDVPMNAPIFLESVSYAVTLLTTGDENNYRAFRVQRRLTTGSTITVYDSPVKLFDSSVRQQIYNEPINLFSSGTPGQPLTNELLGYTFVFAAFGTAPNGTNPSATLKFREILS